MYEVANSLNHSVENYLIIIINSTMTGEYCIPVLACTPRLVYNVLLKLQGWLR